jgi:hypothetical protein
MKLKEVVKEKKTKNNENKKIMILNEIQFRALSEKLLSQRDMRNTNNTQLSKSESNAKKK